MTAGRPPSRRGPAALALSEAVRSLVAPLRWLSRRGPRRAAAPLRILFAPQDLRTSDPTVAADLLAGTFVLAGQAVETGGGSPFEARSPSRAWSEALLGFGWLRHLRGADTGPARDRARALLAEAATRRARLLERGPGRATTVVARRVIALLCGSPLLLTGADHALYAAYLDLIGRSVALLERDLVTGRRADRLPAAIALSYAALCCSGLENRLRRASRALVAELTAQIGPEGGHLSRHPGLLVELLLDLMPLRLLFASRGVEVPEALSGAIDRMLPMLRYMRHGSGELALFNGMGATAIDQLATLFAHDVVRAPAPADAPASGYARLKAGDTLVFVDVGDSPPLAFSGAAAAGVASFELSSGTARLVVNSGAPREGPLSLAARRTAMQSTLAVGRASTALFLSDRHGPLARWLAGRLGPVLLAGPGPVVTRRAVEGGGAGLTVRHDGYLARFGIAHERRLTLEADGTLSGQDAVIPVAGGSRVTADIAVQFCLHPSVTAGAGPARGSVRLTAGNGETWAFEAESGEVALEAGTYFAGPDRARPCARLVVRPDIDVFHGATTLRWRFARTAPDAAS